METYIILGNYTQQGLENVKEGPQRIEAARRALDEAGGKMIGWHLTMGRYDFMAVVEAPNADVVARIVLASGMMGNVETETLRAWSEAEFTDLVGSLP